MNTSRQFKGGNGLLPLTPGHYKGVGTIAVAGDANYAKMPNKFSSNQVGGKHKHKRSKSKRSQRGGMGYGFANPAAAPYAAGSYFPITPTCASALDASRGGNNFMSGGSKKRGSKSKRSKSKRSKSKRSKSNKRSKSKGGKKNKTQKWRQKGCSKMMGGMIMM
jgi:hypothetical protein